MQQNQCSPHVFDIGSNYYLFSNGGQRGKAG